MEEKPAELPVLPQEVQIQPPNLLDKIKLHKFRILGGILGILVFTGAVFGAYKLGQKQVSLAPQSTPTPATVATPTPDLTADWKTYTNTKYGYSIKYPLDFEIKETDIENTPLIGGISILDPRARDEKIAPKYRFLFTVSLYGTEKSSIEEIYKEPLSQYLGQKEFANIETITWIEVGGKSAIRTTGSSTGGFFDRVEMINRGIRLSIDETAFTKEEREANKQTLNLMLSTFRFLEERSQPQVSVPQPVGLARQDLAERLGLSTSSVEILEIEEVLWPDTCLGLPAPELCARGETPGYRVTMMTLGQKYTYHTNTSENFRYAGPGDTPQRP